MNEVREFNSLEEYRCTFRPTLSSICGRGGARVFLKHYPAAGERLVVKCVDNHTAYLSLTPKNRALINTTYEFEDVDKGQLSLF